MSLCCFLQFADVPGAVAALEPYLAAAVQRCGEKVRGVPVGGSSMRNVFTFCICIHTSPAALPHRVRWRSHPCRCYPSIGVIHVFSIGVIYVGAGRVLELFWLSGVAALESFVSVAAR